MSSALRSSVIESLMLLVMIVWAVAFGASLLHPGAAAFEGHAAVSSQNAVDSRQA